MTGRSNIHVKKTRLRRGGISSFPLFTFLSVASRVAHRATSLSFNSQEPATAVHNYHVSGLLSPPSTETPCRTGTTVHKIPMIQYDHIDLNDMAVNAMCDLPCLKHAHSISSSRARLTHARRRPR